MRLWISKIAYLLPLTPWGERRRPGGGSMPEGEELLHLQLVMLELLTKARDRQPDHVLCTA